ncbi:LysE family translocator [Commensalibacter communis]|uniref:LysE family translocator n=1 Tax=Commensalibacter communis TaxID=2972786 RepID=UPI0022FF6273|nr:LysE family translocator [Commensalibacter communis]CAI3957266.1 Threonine/homoserine/homoserine lactone efflux protein (RhtB) [Commensalibacter communis]CAI3957387.1 Threonine/homoserine/homoserine lactone efflux protein (RhtB) [Commensalibacter communis]
MIHFFVWLQFLTFIVPLVFSPGPGNTTFAAMGSQYKFAGTLRFWMGFELGDIFLCSIYAFGLGELIHRFHSIEIGLKWAGIAFLFYLTWTFARSAIHPSKYIEKNTTPALGFVDGFLSVFLNPKIHTMLLALFSQFGALNSFSQLSQLTLGFLIVSIIGHGIWIAGGHFFLSRFQSNTAQRVINSVFALSIAWTAITMI